MSELTITITRQQFQDAVRQEETRTLNTGQGQVVADRLWKKLGGKESTEELLDEARVAYSQGRRGSAADAFSRLDNALLNGGKLPGPWLDAAIETLKEKYGQKGVVFLDVDEADSLAEFLINALAREGYRVRVRGSMGDLDGDTLKAMVVRWLSGWREGES
jgi:hypothetical protein